ncbi:hypothetical protein ABEB36_001643 [Hypothenemus hampei]|uniref:Uncharacterized protein n=1 Tax=Hypothenemus hampei TaxID=57062 RepID=A0ABD1FFB3_HYPHA
MVQRAEQKLLAQLELPHQINNPIVVNVIHAANYIAVGKSKSDGLTAINNGQTNKRKRADFVHRTTMTDVYPSVQVRNFNVFNTFEPFKVNEYLSQRMEYNFKTEKAYRE